MALSSRSILSMDEAEVILTMDSDDADSVGIVEFLLNGITESIEKATGQKYVAYSITNEIVNGTGRKVMYTRHRPIVVPDEGDALVVYIYNGSTWDNVVSSPFALTPAYEEATGKIYFTDRYATFPAGDMNIKFVYTAGYATQADVPFNIKQAAGLLLSMYYEKHKRKLTGIATEGIDGVTTTFEMNHWPDDVMYLLGLAQRSPYRHK